MIQKVIEESAGFALRGSKSRCVLKVPNDLWPVEADEGQLGQVIHNLMINADQAMPEGGTVTVTAANIVLGNNSLSLESGDYVTLSVSDQGIGIPQEYSQKIFDPYFTTKHKGSGLGLATSYSVIKRHDGHITVESTLSKGSTFHVYLPASRNAAYTNHNAGTAPIRGSGRILIMDDEEMIREVASKILVKLGYEVECSRDGAEAISLYEKARHDDRPFNAVIMDLTIPGGMGGKEAVKKLHEIDPGVKAIVSSGYSHDPIMSQFKDFGFCGVVSKPYTVKILSDVIHKVIAP